MQRGSCRPVSVAIRGQSDQFDVGYWPRTCHCVCRWGMTGKSKGFGRREAYESLTCTTRGRQPLRYGDLGSAPWEIWRRS